MGRFSDLDIVRQSPIKKYAVILDDNVHYPIYYEILEYSGRHVLLYDSIFNQTKLALQSEIWQLT